MSEGLTLTAAAEELKTTKDAAAAKLCTARGGKSFRNTEFFVFEGDSVLVRAGVAFLLRKEMTLLGCRSIAEAAVVVDGGDGARAKGPRALGQNGEEEKWIALVREAGKA